MNKVRKVSAAVQLAKTDPARIHREQAMDVLQQFRFIFKSIKKHFQWVERETGMSGSQLWALATIAGAPGLRVTELARALAIHQTTASNLIDKLEQRKLLRRERASTDQRVVRLYLTKSGLAVVAKAPRPFEGVLPDALMHLPKAELRKLDGMLKSLTRHMQVRDVSGKRTPLADM